MRASARPSGRLLRKTRSPVLRDRRAGDAGMLLSGRIRPVGTTVLGRSRGPGPGGMSRASRSCPRGEELIRSSAGPSAMPGPSPRDGPRRSERTVPGNRDPDRRRKPARDERKPRRVSAPKRPPGRDGVRILAGSKTLKPRGIVISWSSELENAMSKTAGRDLAPKGVRLCEGERL